MKRVRAADNLPRPKAAESNAALRCMHCVKATRPAGGAIQGEGTEIHAAEACGPADGAKCDPALHPIDCIIGTETVVRFASLETPDEVVAAEGDSPIFAAAKPDFGGHVVSAAKIGTVPVNGYGS